MSNETFYIQKENGHLTSLSKNMLRKMVNCMEENKPYQITIKQQGYRAARYKYYWAHILKSAVHHYNKLGKYQIIDESTGEALPLDCDTLHTVFKQMYNPIIITVNGNQISRSGSTKVLTDEQFINEYEMQIIDKLVTDGVQVMTREEYNAMSKEGHSSENIIESLYDFAI